MKRVVECPSCHTKLQIFDIGKKIDQKCPRCTKTFVIEPEGEKKKTSKVESVNKETTKEAPTQENPAKEATDKKDAAPATEETKTDGAKKKIMVKPPITKSGEAVAKTDKKADDKPEDKKGEEKKDEPDKSAINSKTSGAFKKSSSPTTPKKTLAPAFAPSATLEPEPPLAGLSGLQFMILAALLVVVIVMQVINQKKSSALADNQKLIYEQVKRIN